MQTDVSQQSFDNEKNQCQTVGQHVKKKQHTLIMLALTPKSQCFRAGATKCIQA